IKPNQQVSHRGFTYTAPPENGTNGTWDDVKRDVVEDRQVFIAEADIFKRDVAAHLFEWNGVEIVTDFDGSIQQFKKAAQRCAAGYEARIECHQILHRRQQSQVIRHERHQRACGQATLNDETASIKKNRRSR